ncbi:hypothetical protein M422DRAFT_74371 [Sphaerobolus stellatus SS14]|nr:hypothetical protein M422DRAFT_74371 [Sphaerobolus stellatus SS14]
MDAPNGTFSHLNPNTSLAFLPSGIATQLEATRYLSVAVLGIFTWDVLCSLSQDYRLLTKHKINLPTISYFVSRIASFAHILATTLFHVAPFPSCNIWPILIGIFWAFAIPSTSLLFFFRVKAVFNGNNPVIFTFIVLWLVNLAGSITVPFALSAGNIGPTNFCIIKAVKPFSSAGIIATACYDTLVFVAVSWRIITKSAMGDKTQSFFRGRNLPHVSRELLRGGQLYYLLTVGGNIILMALLLAPSVPPVIRDMFPILNMALENSMACRVFRNIKLGSKGSPSQINDSGNSNNNLLPTRTDCRARYFYKVHCHPSAAGQPPVNVPLTGRK